MNIVTVSGIPAVNEIPVEVAERKGVGHPDTLADGLAEAVSRVYSRYCLEHFGAILHHNTDKSALLGGAAEVAFGGGRLTAPIIALINGRLTPSLGDHVIPVEALVTEVAREFLAKALPLLDVDSDLQIRSRVSQASSPGAVGGPTGGQQAGRYFWFAPRDLDDLAERRRLFSNDTSAGVGYWPLSVGERLALGIESRLTCDSFLETHPYVGTDVKVMVVRSQGRAHVTVCVPQISSRTPDLEHYIGRRRKIRDLIVEFAEEIAPGHSVTVEVNTRDDDERRELYLTVTGSSIESGDEGVVGRGNRVNGLISLMRPMSIEAASGKNPIYHVGKLYNFAAQRAAEQLHELTGLTCAVTLVSQSGRDLDDPWQAIVQTSGAHSLDDALARQVISRALGELGEIRSALLAGKLPTA